MKNHLTDILKDLYMLDPGLKNQEKDLKKLIEKLVAAKPDLKIDDSFVNGLRRQLSAKADEMVELDAVSKPGFMQSLHRFIYPFAGGVLATVLVVVVVLSMSDKYQPYFLPVKELGESPKIPVAMEDVKVAEKAEVAMEERLETGDVAEEMMEGFDVIPPLERIPEERIPVVSKTVAEPEKLKGWVGGEANSGDAERMEAPVMMMAMPSSMDEGEIVESDAATSDVETTSNNAVIRKEADDILIAIEKWMAENVDSLSDEQKEILDEKVAALSDLLTNENADPKAIQTATEVLKLELEKLNKAE